MREFGRSINGLVVNFDLVMVLVPVTQPAQVRDFLGAEAGLLRAAERELGQALQRGTGAGLAVAQVDYILLATPEADPLRLAERGNLALALANAGWLRARVERLL